MRRLNYETKDLGFSFACVTAVMVAASIVLELIFGSVAGGWKFWLMQGLYTALIGGSAFLYAALTRTKVFVATKLNKAPSVSHTVWGCVAVMFLVLCMSQINTLFLDIIEKELGLKRPTVSLDSNVAGRIICACILPALTEEIVFRGTIAQSLNGSKSQVWAVVISGALFSVFHANPAQTLHQFVLGAFLTMLVFRSGSLWTSVIVHFFNNAFVVGLSYTPLGSDEFWNLQSNGKWALTLTIVGVVGFVLCSIVYVATTKSQWGANKTDSVEAGKAASAQNNTGLLRPTRTSSVIALVVSIVMCVALWIAQLLLG